MTGSPYREATGTLANVRRLLILALAVAACLGSAQDPPIALVANSDLAVGPQRLLLSLRSLDTAESLDEPDRGVTVEIYTPTGELASSQAAEFLWIVEDVRGLYTTTYTFPEPGIWTVRMLASDLPVTEPTPIQVQPDALTPDVGDEAPPSETPTLADTPLELLTTDFEPDESFYGSSVAEAVASGSPSVIVFATPAFCESAACGPALDVVKSVSGEFPEVNFVHVEVFDLTRVPDELVPVPAVDEWRLPSEPWVFIADASGRIAARFEGVVSAQEIRAALGSF